MNIDVEPRDLGKVVQLVANTAGWKQQDTKFHLDRSILITGNPDPGIINQTPDYLRGVLQAAWLATRDRRPNDHNGLKVAVRRLAVVDGILEIDAVETDYFTAWGLPQAEESKPLFAEHEKNVVINRVKSPDALYQTDIPWAVCSHNVLLDKNGDIIFMIRSMSQGFNQGRVSVTEEEQMETTDPTPYFASHRSFREELGLIIPEQRILLLGVGMEKGAAYPAFGFIAETDVLAKDIVGKWKTARDYNENTALFVVSISQVDKWLANDEVASDVWHKDFLAGNIAPDAKLKLHNTSAWRLGLTQKYIQAA